MSKLIKVLMIEDNPADARLIAEMLKDIDNFDFELLNASRLDEGLKFLITHQFDMIFLDLCLPDSDGIDTFNITNYNAPDLPIIVLTGLENEILAFSAVERGAQDYLVKDNISSQSLLRSIKNSLENQPLKS